MPTYIKKETVGQAASTDRLPISGRDESGNALGVPVLTDRGVTLGSTQAVVPTRRVGSLEKYSDITVISAAVSKGFPGAVTEAKSYPHVFAEGQEESNISAATLPNGGPVNMVGQVFRASLDNVADVVIHIGVLGGGVGLFSDDFESYANDAALQAAWVPSDTSHTQVTLYTAAPYAGSQSMRIQISENRSQGDTVTRTFTAEDWSAVETLTFQARASRDGDRIQMRVRVGDGSSSKSTVVQVQVQDTWEEFNLSLAALSNDGAGSPDMSAITEVEWEVELDDRDGEWIVDAMVVRGSAGTARARLFEVASANPTTLGTQVDGAKTIDLINSPNSRYTSTFAGDALVVGNYYAVVYDQPSASITLDFRGGTQAGGGFYTNGTAFTSTDSGTTLSGVSNTDLAFEIYGRVSGYVCGLQGAFNGAPEGTKLTAYVEDPATEKKVIEWGHDIEMYMQAMTWYWPSSNLLDGAEKVWLPVGKRIDVQVEWSLESLSDRFQVAYLFAYEPFTHWG